MKLGFEAVDTAMLSTSSFHSASIYLCEYFTYCEHSDCMEVQSFFFKSIISYLLQAAHWSGTVLATLNTVFLISWACTPPPPGLDAKRLVYCLMYVSVNTAIWTSCTDKLATLHTNKLQRSSDIRRPWLMVWITMSTKPLHIVQMYVVVVVVVVVVLVVVIINGFNLSRLLFVGLVWHLQR